MATYTVTSSKHTTFVASTIDTVKFQALAVTSYVGVPDEMSCTCGG